MMDAGEPPYALLERELQGTAFSRIRYVESTASTNDDAAALLGKPEAGGLSIIAEHQRAGAGRKGRRWLAEPGTSLLVTTILPRAIPANHLWVVPFGVAICVRRALFANGVASDVHWPNDLLAGGRKIAGILCVSRVTGDRAWVAAGVGINVHRTPGAETAIEPPPAFCDDVNPNASRIAILRSLLLNYDVWQNQLDLPPRIARVWERIAGLPKPYRIVRDGESEPVDMVAHGLSNNGGLIVTNERGQREVISLADARALR
jgi:BirA family biotin operon repressor/biotin-[acetyl-CoA-carboxylase] ligase